MFVRSTLLGLAILLMGLPASAGRARADLAVSIAAPSGEYVYESARYDVVVSNVGKKTASTVELTIALPRTHTSPQVYVLGTLGTIDSRCSQSGTSLICQLGSMAKSTSTTVFFHIALPQSSAPLVIESVVTTSSDEDISSNNTDSETASLLNDVVTVSGPVDVLNEHCTGTGLTSFFECELFPSSLSSHETRFEAGGSITFVNPAAPGYTGTWSQPASNRLTFTYYDGITPVATFNGWGVSASCFEGITTFGTSPYVAPYSVCLD